jgi:hypothetical protein
VRHHALDNLRAFIIFLVVLLHASLSYMAYAPEWWYVLDPERSLVFTGLVLLIDVPIMLIMFFLAGYFTYQSLAKRGAGAFLRDKLVRIGIPWVFGSLVLAPPTAYMIFYSRKLPMSLGTFWATEFWGRSFQQSVYWYLGMLFCFFTLTAITFAWNRRFATWQSAVVQPAWFFFGLFVLAMTAASLAIGLTHPLDQWSHIYVLVFQPARVPLYIGYFALGIFAFQRGWLCALPAPLAAPVPLVRPGLSRLAAHTPSDRADDPGEGDHDPPLQPVLLLVTPREHSPVPPACRARCALLAKPGPELLRNLLPAPTPPLSACPGVRAFAHLHLPQGHRHHAPRLCGLLGPECGGADPPAGTEAHVLMVR